MPTAVGIRVFGCTSPDGRTTFGFTILGLLLMTTNQEYANIYICIHTINNALFSSRERVQWCMIYTKHTTCTEKRGHYTFACNLTDLDKIWYSDADWPPGPSRRLKFCVSENQRRISWRQPVCQKSLISSAIVTQ